MVVKKTIYNQIKINIDKTMKKFYWTSVVVCSMPFAVAPAFADNKWWS